MEYLGIGFMLCTVALLGYAIFLIVDTGQMSDAEREKLGLGPKYGFKEK